MYKSLPARLHIPQGYCQIKVPQTRLDRHPVMDLLALVVKQAEAATRSPGEKIKAFFWLLSFIANFLTYSDSLKRVLVGEWKKGSSFW